MLQRKPTSRRRLAAISMSVQIVTTTPGVFDFLGLPPELRNRIYQLHLSKGGDVGYQGLTYEGIDITFDRPTRKILLGVNILRLCRQIHNESLTFAYADRRWDLGDVPRVPHRLVFDCNQRLACIPHYTIDRVQHLGLDFLIDLRMPTSIVTSVAMGDLSKLKSLQSLELFIILDNGCRHIPKRLRYSDTPCHASPFLVGLVCETLSQIPAHIEVSWLSVVQDKDGNADGDQDADLIHIAERFGAIQGCNSATSI